MVLGRKNKQLELIAQLSKTGNAEALIAALDRLTEAVKEETKALHDHQVCLNKTVDKLADAFIQAGLIKNQEGEGA